MLFQATSLIPFPFFRPKTVSCRNIRVGFCCFIFSVLQKARQLQIPWVFINPMKLFYNVWSKTILLLMRKRQLFSTKHLNKKTEGRKAWSQNHRRRKPRQTSQVWCLTNIIWHRFSVAQRDCSFFPHVSLNKPSQFSTTFGMFFVFFYLHSRWRTFY